MQTFTVKHTHLVTPVGADFGYADVTLATRTDSPRHRPPPSPSPRFQPSPQPYLQQPPPTSLKPFVQQPFPASSRGLCLQSPPSSTSKPSLLSSSPASPCLQSPSASPSRPFSPAPPHTNPPQPLLAPPPRQSQASLLQQDLKEGVEELPAGAEPLLRADLAVRKKDVGSGVGGEPRTESPAVSCRTMGDSKENKSPRSSTSENLQTLSLKEHYEIERELGRGTYGKVS